MSNVRTLQRRAEELAQLSLETADDRMRTLLMAQSKDFRWEVERVIELEGK
jgi:hypothetical protein